MNQKPEMPGDDDILKRHPARRPSNLEVDRKLKPHPEDQDPSGEKPATPPASHPPVRRQPGDHAA